MIVCETEDEATALQAAHFAGRELVNLILFESEGVPEPILAHATLLYSAFNAFDEAQEEARQMRELIHNPPQGLA